jgi:hypothetical protein
VKEVSKGAYALDALKVCREAPPWTSHCHHRSQRFVLRILSRPATIRIPSMPIHFSCCSFHRASKLGACLLQDLVQSSPPAFQFLHECLCWHQPWRDLPSDSGSSTNFFSPWC